MYSKNKWFQYWLVYGKMWLEARLSIITRPVQLLHKWSCFEIEKYKCWCGLWGWESKHSVFADDIVLIAENPNDLQVLLNILSAWCKLNGMVINGTKSNIVHFRTPSVPRSDSVFIVGGINLDVVESYKYLGLVLTEFLDYSKTAKAVAKSANRALGLIIAKSKAVGGLPYDVFYKLYESIVCPVIMYGAPIWGDRMF